MKRTPENGWNSHSLLRQNAYRIVIEKILA
jgi:hypothetical protein